MHELDILKKKLLPSSVPAVPHHPTMRLPQQYHLRPPPPLPLLCAAATVVAHALRERGEGAEWCSRREGDDRGEEGGYFLSFLLGKKFWNQVKKTEIVKGIS